MKSLIEFIIRIRNPAFKLDPSINNSLLLQFVNEQVWALLRGQRLWFHFRRPRKLMLGRRVNFFNLTKIRMGKWVRLGRDVRLSALGSDGIDIGDHVSIGDFSRVIVSTTLNDLGAHIRLGNNVGIGEFAYLGGAGGLEIGDDCIIGQYFSCHPENHRYMDPTLLIRRQGVTRKGIRVGKNCWIGSRVTILDGVRIGDHCVIAAGSVVTRSFPDNCVIGGVPAKLIKNIQANENDTSHNLRCQSV